MTKIQKLNTQCENIFKRLKKIIPSQASKVDIPTPIVAADTMAIALSAYALSSLHNKSNTDKTSQLNEKAQRLIAQILAEDPKIAEYIKELLNSDNVDIAVINELCENVNTNIEREQKLRSKRHKFPEERIQSQLKDWRLPTINTPESMLFFLERANELGSENTKKIIAFIQKSNANISEDNLFSIFRCKDTDGNFLLSGDVLIKILNRDFLDITLKDETFLKIKDNSWDSLSNSFNYNIKNGSYNYERFVEELTCESSKNGDKKLSQNNNVISEVYTYNLPDGEKIRLEYLPSDIDSAYNIFQTDLSTNKRTQIRKVYKDENGTLYIEQNSISLNGDRIRINYKETPNGDTNYSFTISDRNGEELLSRTNEKTEIGENTFLHSINGQLFIVEFKDNYQCEITNFQTNNVKTIDFSKNLIDAETEKKKAMYDLLKKLSVEDLLALENTKLGIYSKNNGFFCGLINTILTAPIPSTMAHEIGHKKDFQVPEYINFDIPQNIKEILLEYEDTMSEREKQFIDEANTLLDKIAKKNSDNSEFLNAYENEKNAFIQKHSKEKQQDISYFIDFFDEKDPTRNNGLQEVFAEINMLLTTPTSNGKMRTQVLLDNFPRTIVAAGKLIQAENESLLNF